MSNLLHNKLIKLFNNHLLNIHINWSIWFITYKAFLFLFFNDGILNIPGNKYKPKEEINEVPKLIKVSFITAIRVLRYTAIKHER